MKVENLYTPNCIRTVSGIYMNVFEPTPEMICIEDIAHALSHQCRYGGHLPKFYSVAEHSMYCFSLANEKDKFSALMHDASEAYLLDIPSPIKAGLSNYKELEDKLMTVIANKFGFEWPMNESIKTIDKMALESEWDFLMLEKCPEKKMFECFSSVEAKQNFITCFNYITKK